MERAEGLPFSTGGLSAPDEPVLAVRDLSGALRVWIEVAARMAFALSISHRELFVSMGDDTLTGQVVRRPIVVERL